MSRYRVSLLISGVMAGVTSGLGVTVAQAAVVQVVAIRLEQTLEGLTLYLDTTDHQPPQAFIAEYGQTWQADITNAQLASGAMFEQVNPIAGIELITVTALDANSIRVRVTGQDAPPTVAVTGTGEGALSLAIAAPQDSPATAAASEPSQNEPLISQASEDAEPADASATDGNPDALRITVTGESAGSDYFVPNTGTGTRTDTPLLDIPASVQVIPQEVLEDQQVIRLDDALRNVSGVVADNTEGAGLQFGLRGFAGASILRDGLSLSGSNTNRGIIAVPELANIEQIEVLKGPASILYGEIQPGGVINLVTERPTADPLYELTLQAGRDGLFRPQIDMSDRLNADGSVRYRLNALVQRQDGFRAFDQKIEREFIAPVITWDISDRTSFTVDFEYFQDERPSDSGLLAFGNGIIDLPRNRITGEPDDVIERDFFSVGYELTHAFNENWRLRNAFRYSNQNYSSNFFTPPTSAFFNEAAGLLGRLGSATEWDQATYGVQTDVVGTFETGSIGHTLLAGVDLAWSHSDIRARVSDLGAPFFLDVFNPTYGLATRLPFEQLPIDARFEEISTSRWGIFLQDQIDVSDSLILVAGVRYDSVSQDASTSTFITGNTTSSQTVDAFTPRFGIVYQPIPQLSLYGSYSRSFTPSASTDVAGRLLEPEEGEGFEVGIKTELFDQRLVATLAYFDITRQNVATADPTAPLGISAFLATGEQRSQGIELDIAGEILPGWNIIANYAYTDARITQDNTFPAGNGLTGIPENSASLWTTYTLQTGGWAGLGFGVGVNYVGDRPGDLDNSFQMGDYWVTNAAIFYEQDDFGLSLYFNNLFDINYVQGIPISRVRGIEPGEPFTVTGSLTFRF
ncbi:MAG: TonB-dependent siderophore receptor [Cyanobacteria bacterium J06639_14]